MVDHSVEVVTFEQALELTKGLQRDLLLGNGFSMGAHEAFNYWRLLERASIPDDIVGIFASLRTANFEAVMRLLLAEAQGSDPSAVPEARRKIEALKAALIRSIHEVHPKRRSEIGAVRWGRCEEFLQHFIGRGRGGRVFTTNYDLLLCWAIAPDRDRPTRQKRLLAYEGFRGGTYQGCGSATVIYLHGALHLFRTGSLERQLSYRDTGMALHDQIAELLEQGHFPIFVSEGASSLKEPRSQGFLRDALNAFKGTCRTPSKKALFTLGHGLGAEDAHILRWIAEGKIPTVYLGAYGAREIEDFKLIAASWIGARAASGKPPLKVYIFDSTGVVWGP